MANAYKFVRPSPDSTTTMLQRIADGAFIPPDPLNRDYQEFLAAGSPADPAPDIVQQIVLAVRPVALRYVLRHRPDPKGTAASLLAAIGAALTGPANADTLDNFQNNVLVYRTDLLALVPTIGATVQFTPADVDSWLTAAAARPNSGAVMGFA